MSHRTAASLKASWTASSAARRSPRVARRVVRTCLRGGSGDVDGHDVGGVPVLAAACPQWRIRVSELSEYPVRIVVGAMDQDLGMEAAN